MKKTIITFLCGISLFFAGCGILGGSGLKVKVPGKEADFTPKLGFAYSTTMGANIIHLANFEIPDFKNDSASHQKLKADADDKIRIEIVLRIKDKKENTAFEPGEYVFRDWSKSSGSDKPEKEVDRIEVYFPNNGKEKGELLSHTGNGGTLNLTSVTDDKIAGTINIEGKDGVLKGNFTAKRAAK
jgi:hypothetical protein